MHTRIGHLSPTAPLPDSSVKTKKGDRNECSSYARETEIVLLAHSCIGGERREKDGAAGSVEVYG